MFPVLLSLLFLSSLCSNTVLAAFPERLNERDFFQTVGNRESSQKLRGSDGIPTTSSAASSSASSETLVQKERRAWEFLQGFTGRDQPGDNYGTAVAMNANASVIAVGGVYFTGIQIFQYNADSRTYVRKGNSGADLPVFATSMAMDDLGETLIIGDYLQSSNRNADCSNIAATDCESGAIYVYKFDGTDWKEQFRVEETVKYQALGSDVAISSDGNFIAAAYSGEVSEDGTTINVPAFVKIWKYDSIGLSWGEWGLFDDTDIADATGSERKLLVIAFTLTAMQQQSV